MTGPLPDHALLVRYLLGELPEEARLKIEQDCIANDKLFEQLEAIEAELTDDYVRGALRGRKRQEFEQRLLKTAQVDLSKLLVSQSESTRLTAEPWWTRQSWLQRSAGRLFCAFATLCLATFLCWFSLAHYWLLPKPAAQPPLVAQHTQPPTAETSIPGALVAPAAPRKSVARHPSPPRPSSPMSAPASAPPPTPGNLQGTIVDASGAAIPNAQVAITNPTTGVIARSQTDSTGKYTIQLPAGDYALSASASGFQPSNLQARIIPDQTAIHDIALAVSAATTTVEVTSSAPVVDTTSAQQSDTINNQALVLAPRSFAYKSLSQSVVPAITPPNNATDIFVNTSIVVFTQTATITLSSPNGPVSGAITASTNHRYLTFTPSPGLSANTRYNVLLNGAVRASFTTGASSENTAPTVQKISTTPYLVLQFNKPMDPSSFNAIPATIRFSPDLRTVTCISNQPITLTTAVKDIYGNSLPNQISF